MLIVTDVTTAYELAAVADAAATDNGRPILASVHLTWEETPEGGAIFRVAATDSHMLAVREITLPRDKALAEDGDEDFEGILIDAKVWKKTLREAAAAKVLGTQVLINIDTEAGTVEIGRDRPGHPDVTLNRHTDGTFPKWQQLMGTPTTVGEFTLPAFNPVYISRVAAFVSAKPTDRKTTTLRMQATDDNVENSVLKPWLFTGSRGDSDLTVLLMPVRV